MASFRIRKEESFDSISVNETDTIPSHSGLPTIANSGDIIFDSIAKKCAYFDGTSWVYITTPQATTLSDTGAGSSLITNGVGPALSIRKLAAGSNITLVQNPNDVTIHASVPAPTVTTLSDSGAGASLIINGTGPALTIKKLVAGSNISLVQNPNDVTISLNNGPFDFIDNQTFIVDAVDPTKSLGFDVQGTTGTTTTLGTSQTVNRNFITPDISGTALVSEVGTGMVYVNSTTQQHGSNAGLQFNSTVANRAQFRGNQYGVNGGVPGITGFKSRGITIGSLAPVQVGDVIFRATAIGVTDNLNIPLSGLLSINVASVPAGQGYLGTNFEVDLTSEDGPGNGHRVVYRLDGEGRIHLLETTSPGSHTTVPSDVVTLGAGGTITIANSKIPANGRVILTVQPAQAPLGTVWVSNITAGVSFTISSTNAADAGVNVYYQVYIPL